MSTHTPGSWFFQQEDIYTLRFYSAPTRGEVAVKHFAYGDGPSPTDLADAHLIAAAPELLEVAQDASQQIEYLIRELKEHVYWKEIHNGKRDREAIDLSNAAVDDARYTLKNISEAIAKATQP